jgi:Fe2+ or Zn2+ uptake regulation protein
MVASVRPPAELVDAFRAQGLKVTPQRQLLFRLLHGNTQHPTADLLYAQASDRMPGISLRTVYQTLTDLTAMGELQQVSFDTGATHFDPNVADHHHAVCDTCGTIIDVYVDGADQLAIDGLDGFRPAVASIVFHGSCAGCAGT